MLHSRESSGPLTGFPLAPVDARGDRGVPVATRPAKGAGRKIQEVIMRNRAVITTPERKIGLYLHWNDGTPLVGRYDHDGDWSWNPNNRVKAETVRIAPRG